MKKYISLMTIVAFTCLTACDNLLDLEPSQSISEDLALTSDANVKSVLIGVYSMFDDPGIYGGGILRNAELLGGNGEIQWVGTYIDPRQIYNKTILASNSEPYVQWRDSYEVINACNNIISALAVVKEADRDRVEGEALFLRSLMFFDLVRFFGQPFDPAAANTHSGVPVILTPTRGISQSSNVGRNTVAEVYLQVITDLITAAAKLPAKNGVYASKGAANALLARVYLQKGDFDNARKAANAVITSAEYEILPLYSDVFNQDNNTREDIFATQITPQDRFSSMTEFFSVPVYGGRDGDIDILDGHLNLYPAGDRRKDLFFMGNGAMRTGKWNNQYGSINLFRLAEMYLIRAEGNIRLGGTPVGPEPLVDYNVIRTRAGLPAAGAVTLNDILLERRLELAFEGHRIHDIKRLKLSVATWPYNDPKLVFPIPARELEANPTLKTQQNPGY